MDAERLEDFRDYLRFLRDCCLKHEIMTLQDIDDIETVLAWEESVPDGDDGYALFKLREAAMRTQQWGVLREAQDYTGHG